MLLDGGLSEIDVFVTQYMLISVIVWLVLMYYKEYCNKTEFTSDLIDLYKCALPVGSIYLLQ